MQNMNDGRNGTRRRVAGGAMVIFAAIAAFGGGVVLPGCADSSREAAATEAVPANAILVNFKVEGLHCHGCAATVRNSISKIDGVRRCNVSFDEGSAEVVINLDDEDAIIAAIVEKVTDEGFTIERSGSES